MIFGDYIKLSTMNENKSTYDVEISNEVGIENFIEKTEDSRWYKFVDGDIFLIYNKHYLNMNELQREIIAIYSTTGYIGIGFSKLTIDQLLKYSVVRDIIKPYFSDLSKNINCAAVANTLLHKEFIV